MTMMHWFIVCTLLLFIGCEDGPSTKCGEKPPNSSVDFRTSAPKATSKTVRIFTGVERGHSGKSEVTIEFNDYFFFSEPAQPTDEDADAFTKLFGVGEWLTPFRGAKLCGGFHPDYCIEWIVDGQPYRAMLCLSCHEVKMFGGEAMVYFDVQHDAFPNIVALLKPYKRR